MHRATQTIHGTARILFASVATGLIALQSLAATGSGPSGEDQQAALDPIVIVASKTPRSIRDVPNDVTVLTRDDLDAVLDTSLADVFRYTPGIDYEGGGTRFLTEGINIRGIGGNRVAIEIDGIPVSEQFDVGRFSNTTRDFVDTGIIGQIEVLRGPASALYGSAAIGGVVAMRTQDPRVLIRTGRYGGDIAVTYRGDDNSRHTRAGFAAGREDLALLVSGSWRHGGLRESNANGEAADGLDYQREAAAAKLIVDDRLGGDWRLGLMHQASDVESDMRSILGSGRLRSTTSLTGDDEYRADMAHLTYEFPSPGGWFDHGIAHVYYGLSDVTQDTVDLREAAAVPVRIDRRFDYEQRVRGFELNLERSLRIGQWQHEIGFGVEWNERRTAEMRDGTQTGLDDGVVSNTVLGEVFPVRDFPLTTTREWGTWIADHATLGRVTIAAALRSDHNALDPRQDPIFAADNPAATPVSVSESDLSPRLGLIVHATPSTDLFVHYAHGFRAPPFEDANIGLDIPLFNIRAIPNPDLESESSDGIDIGLRWRGERSRLNATVFRTHYDDFIATKVRLGLDPLSGRVLFQSQNIEKARIHGAELRWDQRLAGILDGFRLHASAFWAEGENKENGEALNSVGPAQAVVAAVWSSPDRNTEAKVVATLTRGWSHLDETGGELFKPAGYGLLDVYLTRHIGKQLVARAGVRNLTDRTYWLWSNIRGLAPNDAALPVLAEPGRNYSLNIEWRW